MDFFREALSTEIYNKDEIGIKEFSYLFPNEDTGVAQGSSLSAFAGNVLLRELDKELNTRGITMIRYIDDFVILGKSESSVTKAFRSSQKILNKLGLSAYDYGEDGTKYTQGSIRNSFDFLGCTINSKFIIPSDKSQKNLLIKVKNSILHAKTTISKFEDDTLARRAENTLIQSLATIDRQIRGWGDAFSSCNNNQPFNKLDRELDKVIFDYLHQQLRELHAMSPSSKRRMLGVALLKDRMVN